MSSVEKVLAELKGRCVCTFRTGLIIQKASSSLQIQVSKSCHFLMYMYNFLSAIHLLNTWF